MTSGRIYNLQRFTIHDGPGIRTGIFFQGCHLRCPWCHSPDSQAPDGELVWFPQLCLGLEKCGQCLKAPVCGALSPGARENSRPGEEIRLIEIDRASCTGCLKCVDRCPAGALYHSCRKATVDELMEVIEKDLIFYRHSGGGVTISGGEAMLQLEFLDSLLAACKSRGLHTALDTTGSVSWSRYELIADKVDLLLYDLKCLDAEKLLRSTGADLSLVLDNARRLALRGSKIQMRYPVIPGFNDDMANVEGAADFCASIKKSLTGVQVLPYHRLGQSKYERIGRKYTLADTPLPSKDRLGEIRACFADRGLFIQQ